MNKLFINNIGDLAEAQRASFYHFLSYGITEELSHFPNPFISRHVGSGKKTFPCLTYFYPSDVKFKGPNFSIDKCLKKNLSYNIQIYVNGEYYLIDTGKNKLKEPFKKKVRAKVDIFFGEIPLMTEEGTFILNGCERVIISQIIRSPGVYFRKEFGTVRKTIYTATIISNKGLWTKIILDQTDPKKEKNTNVNSPKKDRIYLVNSEFKLKNTETKKRYRFIKNLHL